MAPDEIDNPLVDGLPDDVRVELMRLAQAQEPSENESESTDTGETQTPPATQRKPRASKPATPAQTNDQPPAWVGGLTETLQGMAAAMQQQAESNRVLQGQIRRMDTRDTTPQPKPQADPLAGIDLEDPAMAALARLVTGQNAEIQSLKGMVQTHQQSFAMDDERRAWGAWAKDMAAELDVPFSEVEAELAKIPNERFAIDARKAITTAAKKSRGKVVGNDGGEPSGDGEANDKARKVIEYLQELGAWDDVRTTLIGGRGGNAEADNRTLERMNSSGNIDLETIKAIANRYK